MTTADIRQKLYALQDEPYRVFQAKLIPTIDPETMIGVRTPALRKLVKDLSKEPEINTFLQELPHRYFDENQLHAYINMMIAWYFATALAKQYEAVLPYIEQKRLAPWTHNKAIQKAAESFRITPERKKYLRSLKVKTGK